MSKRRDPLLLEVMAAIGAGNLSIGPIHADDQYVHGFATRGSGAVRINPAPEICNTAIHEMVHRLRPKWKEHTVRQRTGKLMKVLTDDEIDKIYELVLVTAKRRKRALKIDTD